MFLQAPYPEFYLPGDDINEDEKTIFEQLKDTMERVPCGPDWPEDRYVYKRVIRGGSGTPVGRKQTVVVHYTGEWLFLGGGGEGDSGRKTECGRIIRQENLPCFVLAHVEYADEPVDVSYSRAMKRSFKMQWVGSRLSME